MTKELTRESILADWNDPKGSMVTIAHHIVAIAECNRCHTFDYVQHQGICIECMLSYAKTSRKIQEEHAGKCSMCDKVLTAKEQESDIPYLKGNTCESCLDASF